LLQNHAAPGEPLLNENAGVFRFEQLLINAGMKLESANDDSGTAACPGESSAVTAPRWSIATLIRVASWLATFVGINFLIIPFSDLVTPESSLMLQKCMSAVGGLAIFLALGVGSLLLGLWLRGKYQYARQRQNDETAQRIMKALQADPAARVPAFYLYLRAFETTGKLRVPLYLRLRKLSLGLLQMVTNDLESHVTTALRRLGPMVALGHPGETFGAGRIATDERDWHVDVVTLMRRASGILLVPSNRPGTVWELDTLKREGLLNRAMFIMPPRSKGGFDTEEHWETARQVMRTHGLDAPEHQKRGLMFKVGPDERVSNVEPLLINSQRQFRKSVGRLLAGARPAGGLYKAIALADKRARRAAFWGWSETIRQLSPFAVIGLTLTLGIGKIEKIPGP
jgi:hypothetical protein